MQSRLKKLQKTTEYVRGRIETQKNAKKKFEFVVQMVKKKLLSHNRRIETLLFSSFKPLELNLEDVDPSDTAFISLFKVSEDGSSFNKSCVKCHTQGSQIAFFECASCSDIICSGA